MAATRPMDISSEATSPDERAAVGDLYDMHHDAVRAFARRLLGDATAAEDLVHDVFLALPRALRRYRGDASLRTFLLAIAVGVARKHARSAARRRNAIDRAAREDRAPVATPEEDFERVQLAANLHRALDALPLAQRVAFVLLEIEERSTGEAAQIAGTSEATMRTRLFHAKRKLREILRKRGIA